MAAAAFLLVRTQVSQRDWLLPIAVGTGAFALSSGLAINPIAILALAGVLGFFVKSR